MKILEQSSSPDLSNWEEMTFCTYLNMLMEARSLGKSDLIRLSHLPRTYAYQIFDGSRVPGKSKVVQLALAMKLGIDDTNRLLALSSNGSLYARQKWDALVISCLFHESGVLVCNEKLDEAGLDLLF